MASVAVLGLATPASAAPPAPPPHAAPAPVAGLPPLPPPPPPPVIAPTAEQVDRLQQRLLASQQTIATLERELADAKNRAVLMESCRVKNGRLVFIGRELIEGYGRKYRDNHKDPLQLGRRRFEFELQSLSEALYDNRADVPIHVPGRNSPEALAPAADTPPTPAAPTAPAPPAASGGAAPAAPAASSSKP